MPPHLPGPRCHEVEVCRGREVSEAKVTMVTFSDDLADIIWKVLAHDRLVNIGVLPSVNFTKQKRVAKPGISVWSRIIRLMNNETKSQRKATIPTEEKATTRMLWLLWKIVPQLGCVSQDLGALVTQRGKKLGETRCKKSWDQFEKYGSLSLRHIKQVSEKERTSAWKNTNLKSSSAKSLCFEIWGPVPWRDWKTTAMCPKQGLESCLKQIHVQRDRQGYILLARRKMGTPGCVKKRAGGKRVCTGFRSEYAYGQ